MDLQAKKVRLRRKKAIRAGIKNAVVGMLLVAGMTVGIELFLRAWDAEYEARIEYTQDWIDKIEDGKVANRK